MVWNWKWPDWLVFWSAAFFYFFVLRLSGGMIINFGVGLGLAALHQLTLHQIFIRTFPNIYKK